MTILWAIVVIIFIYYFLKMLIKAASEIIKGLYSVYIKIKTVMVSKKEPKSNKAATLSLRVIAENILSLNKTEDSWKVVLANQLAFLFSGSDELVYSWKYIAQHYGLPTIKEEYIGGKSFLRLKDKLISIHYANDRSDGIREVLALSRLVSDQYEIRYCIDSWHSSDLAYLMLRHSDWQELEAIYSSEKIGYRFLSLPLSYNEFEKAAFTEENFRSYPKASS